MWPEVRAALDTVFPVWVDEDAANRMGDNWQRLGQELTAARDQVQAATGVLPAVWTDSAGIDYRFGVERILNGVGESGGLGRLAQMMQDMAVMSHDYARHIANIKHQIYSELAANAFAFGLSFAMPFPFGQFLRDRIVLGIVGRIAATVRAAATAMRIPAAVQRFLGGAALQVPEEIGIELGAQTLDRLRGYRDGYDWKQVAVAGGAGLGGGLLSAPFAPVGWLVSKPVGSLIRAVPGPPRVQNIATGTGNWVEKATQTFVVNGLTSPIAGVTAQAIADGNVGQLTWADYGKGIKHQFLTAGGLAVSRIAAGFATAIPTSVRTSRMSGS